MINLGFALIFIEIVILCISLRFQGISVTSLPSYIVISVKIILITTVLLMFLVSVSCVCNLDWSVCLLLSLDGTTPRNREVLVL